MTHAAGVAAPSIWVVAISEKRSGRPLLSLPLPHGQDPTVLLAGHGLRPIRAVAVTGTPDPHRLELVYEVEEGGLSASADDEVVPADEDVVARAGEVAVPHQRVSVYAVVRSARGVLMTQMSHQVNETGAWGLPGGGMDPGETPAHTAHREVWEETGQAVELRGLRGVTTSHWVGRAPGRRLEDFHAVRVVYDAWCPSPTEPVVHDVDGTTADAAWVEPAELARLRVVSSWRSLVVALAAGRS